LKGAEGAHDRPVSEPGLDRHDWESEWAGLEPLVVDAPADALPELHDLVERMLVERGYLHEDRTAAEDADPELLAEYVAADDVVRRLDGGETVDPADIGSAVSGLRGVYEFVIAERSAP
jgi:hypothetical protein